MRDYSFMKTLLVAAAVCVVCSIVVSTAAVVLKPLQEANKANDRKRNILVAAGLLKQGKKPGGDGIAALFEKIDARVLDLDTGSFVDSILPQDLDEKAAVKTPGQHVKLSGRGDPAGIRRRANLRVVYFLREDGAVKRIILPVRGKGLWSTMYGFLALDGNGNTIKAMEFYAHGETPGLGAEIDNPRWKAGWLDKQAFDESGQIKIAVIKGKVDTDSDDAVYQVDGISGATITARGVTKLVHFWLGAQGYGPLLAKLQDDNKPTN